MKNYEKSFETQENNVLEIGMPFTNEVMIKQLKSYIRPLLEKRNLARKWSPAIRDFAEISATELSYDDESVEANISTKVDNKSYITALKRIKNNSMMLVGKIILSKNLDISELEKYIIRIHTALDFMHTLGCRTASWLYDRADEYNSSSYVPLSDALTHAYYCFGSDIFNNYTDMQFKNVELQNLNIVSKKQINELAKSYNSLMELAKVVLELEDGDMFYTYKTTLEDFIRNISRILFYMAGQIYFQLDTFENIYIKAKEEISEYISKLEKAVFPLSIYALKYHFKNIDEIRKQNDSMEHVYQNFKNTIYNAIFINKE